MNDRTDLILGEAFCIFIIISFVSQILEFLYWLFFIFIFDGVTLKTQNKNKTYYFLTDVPCQKNNNNNDNDNNFETDDEYDWSENLQFSF